ncbi:allantoin racemase [Kibdelosporangium banguiense]|uniref:Allantoin racemase n=1 Tax=Kibdelosporangium banguiense TaxID=1365924 RepID=A0ABS4TPG9_9PSEU|nr:aspartate/glutamate racemase family protein [Kibdelosporangium banguiense]MBP2325865.1 allantoin racemase [Kibdelosporangium banguiense]
MLIKVINANTSPAMTATIGRSAESIVAPGVEVSAVSPAMGPESIESHYDEALAVPGVLAEIAAGEQEGADGYVIACFGDPGLDAAREIAHGPVVGIAEAAMRTATHLGRGFSVVTTLDRSRGRTWDLADRYGVSRFCLGVHATDIAVLELDSDPDALKKVISASRAAAEADGSDAIVLGCAGMSAFCPVIASEIGLPVVDGVQAAVLLVQSLVQMGLQTGSMGEFAPPLPKTYTGLLRDFERR